MATFRRRLPTGPALFSIFIVCVFITHVWSIFNVLREVPAWVLYLNAGELIGGIAYTQVFALIDSLLLIAGILVVGFLLPRRYFADRFAAQGILVALVVSTWAILAHTIGGAGNMWSVSGLLIGFAAIVVASLVGFFLIRWYERLENALVGLADRLLVLSVVYLALDAVSVLIVVARNV